MFGKTTRIASELSGFHHQLELGSVSKVDRNEDLFQRLQCYLFQHIHSISGAVLLPIYIYILISIVLIEF